MSTLGYSKCSCQHCGTHIEFPVQLVGTQVPCPHCENLTALVGEAPVPLPPSSDAPSPEEWLPEDPIPPAPVSGLYQLATVLVAGVMTLMPLVYVAMVVGAGYGTWHFASHAWSWFDKMGPRGRPLLYFAGVAGGVAVLVFLLAPFFRRRAAVPQALALNPEAEPVLFDFISRICRAVGSPMPVRIDLDCQLNASAGFRRGALHRKAFVLTIGLPLVVALDRRQLAGVLAHEFGHFRQGSAMRFRYWIRRIHGWFAELVDSRTAWEEAWEEGLASGEVDFGLFATRGLIGLTRLPLRLVMFLAEVVSSLLLRQMEFDADRYEIELAGSRAFDASIRRFRVLERALRRSYEALQASLGQRRGVPDNFPAFLLQQESRLPATLRLKLEYDLGKKRAGLFATHPTDAERLERSRQLNAPGRVRGEGTATALFGPLRRGELRGHGRDDLLGGGRWPVS